MKKPRNKAVNCVRRIKKDPEDSGESEYEDSLSDGIAQGVLFGADAERPEKQCQKALILHTNIAMSLQFLSQNIYSKLMIGYRMPASRNKLPGSPVLPCSLTA